MGTKYKYYGDKPKVEFNQFAIKEDGSVGEFTGYRKSKYKNYRNADRPKYRAVKGISEQGMNNLARAVQYEDKRKEFEQKRKGYYDEKFAKMQEKREKWENNPIVKTLEWFDKLSSAHKSGMNYLFENDENTHKAWGTAYGLQKDLTNNYANIMKNMYQTVGLHMTPFGQAAKLFKDDLPTFGESLSGLGNSIGDTFSADGWQNFNRKKQEEHDFIMAQLRGDAPRREVGVDWKGLGNAYKHGFINHREFSDLSWSQMTGNGDPNGFTELLTSEILGDPAGLLGMGLDDIALAGAKYGFKGLGKGIKVGSKLLRPAKYAAEVVQEASPAVKRGMVDNITGIMAKGQGLDFNASRPLRFGVDDVDFSNIKYGDDVIKPAKFVDPVKVTDENIVEQSVETLHEASRWDKAKKAADKKIFTEGTFDPETDVTGKKLKELFSDYYFKREVTYDELGAAVKGTPYEGELGEIWRSLKTGDVELDDIIKKVQKKMNDATKVRDTVAEAEHLKKTVDKINADPTIGRQFESPLAKFLYSQNHGSTDFVRTVERLTKDIMKAGRGRKHLDEIANMPKTFDKLSDAQQEAVANGVREAVKADPKYAPIADDIVNAVTDPHNLRTPSEIMDAYDSAVARELAEPGVMNARLKEYLSMSPEMRMVDDLSAALEDGRSALRKVNDSKVLKDNGKAYNRVKNEVGRLQASLKKRDDEFKAKHKIRPSKLGAVADEATKLAERDYYTKNIFTGDGIIKDLFFSGGTLTMSQLNARKAGKLIKQMNNIVAEILPEFKGKFIEYKSVGALNGATQFKVTNDPEVIQAIFSNSENLNKLIDEAAKFENLGFQKNMAPQAEFSPLAKAYYDEVIKPTIEDSTELMKSIGGDTHAGYLHHLSNDEVMKKFKFIDQDLKANIFAAMEGSEHMNELIKIKGVTTPRSIIGDIEDINMMFGADIFETNAHKALNGGVGKSGALFEETELVNRVILKNLSNVKQMLNLEDFRQIVKRNPGHIKIVTPVTGENGHVTLKKLKLKSPEAIQKAYESGEAMIVGNRAFYDINKLNGGFEQNALMKFYKNDLTGSFATLALLSSGFHARNYLDATMKRMMSNGESILSTPKWLIRDGNAQATLKRWDKMSHYTESRAMKELSPKDLDFYNKMNALMSEIGADVSQYDEVTGGIKDASVFFGGKKSPFYWIQNNPVSKKSGEVANRIEATVRLTQYQEARSAGKSHRESVEKVLESMFDYDNLSPLEEKIKFFIPFYTFPTRNAAFYVKNPAKAYKVASQMEKVRRSSFTMAGEDFDNPSDGMKYAKQSGGVAIPGTNRYFKMNPSYIDFIQMFAHEDVNGAIDEYAGRLNPVWGVPADLIKGRNSFGEDPAVFNEFTGESFTMDDASDPIQFGAQYAIQRMLPSGKKGTVFNRAYNGADKSLLPSVFGYDWQEDKFGKTKKRKRYRQPDLDWQYRKK